MHAHNNMHKEAINLKEGKRGMWNGLERGKGRRNGVIVI